MLEQVAAQRQRQGGRGRGVDSDPWLTGGAGEAVGGRALSTCLHVPPLWYACQQAAVRMP